MGVSKASKLTENENPIARLDAQHHGSGAKQGTSEQASRLEPTLFSSKGAKAMLTRNVFTQQGFINGSFGVVKALMHEQRDCPPNLPQAVVVQFPSFKGKSHLSDVLSCVAITLETAEWWSGGLWWSEKLKDAISFRTWMGHYNPQKSRFDFVESSG